MSLLFCHLRLYARDSLLDTWPNQWDAVRCNKILTNLNLVFVAVIKLNACKLFLQIHILFTLLLSILLISKVIRTYCKEDWKRTAAPIRLWLFTFCALQNNVYTVNPLDSKGNYIATSNTKLVHWPLMGGLLHLVQWGEAWAGCGSAQSPPRCTKCNSPSSTASVPSTVLLWWSVALWF